MQCISFRHDNLFMIIQIYPWFLNCSAFNLALVFVTWLHSGGRGEHSLHFLHIFFLIYYSFFLNFNFVLLFYLYFREKKEEKEILIWEKNINQLPFIHAPTRDQTLYLLVYRSMLQPARASTYTVLTDHLLSIV